MGKKGRTSRTGDGNTGRLASRDSKGRTSRTGDGNTGRLASRDSKNKSGKRNIDRLREMEKLLHKKDVAIGVLKAECERLVASGHRYGAKEEPVKLVTEMLGGSQAETVKEEPVKLVTEMLGGPQAETVNVGDKTAALDKKRVDAVIDEVRLALDANMLEVCLTYGAEDEEDGAWVVVIPKPDTAHLKEWKVEAYPCGDAMVVRAVPVVVDGDA